jgi:hypothetical protein
MQWWREEKRPKWTEVSVELEQGLENSEGYFTIHYSYKKQQKVGNVIIANQKPSELVSERDFLDCCQMCCSMVCSVFGSKTHPPHSPNLGLAFSW